MLVKPAGFMIREKGSFYRAKLDCDMRKEVPSSKILHLYGIAKESVVQPKQAMKET